ncbi:MAG: tetratricopeptide repeat protein [Opitutaceae bacterium]|nr:tetratricopeptide repeat protein [Opitutaceae bacterium]
MKHSRHPYPWRVDVVRAGLCLGAAIFGLAVSAHAAKPKKGEDLPAPSVGLPVAAPSIQISAPVVPGFTLPIATPSVPALADETPQFSASRRAWELKVEEYRRNRSAGTSHPERIEYAEALIHLERYDEAIEELEAVEEKYPEAYANAHLLGVAHERSGNLVAARRWFAAAVERDPEAQEGTGWLRVAMIEAHLALKSDPNWLQTHSVLDGCAGRAEGELVRAVQVQVEGRRDFFAPDDPVLADLYFQIGVRMSAPDDRNKFFALSLETCPLRQRDIDEQMVVRAKGPSDTTTR